MNPAYEIGRWMEKTGFEMQFLVPVAFVAVFVILAIRRKRGDWVPEEERPEGFKGELDGVPYTVGCYYADGTVTVEIPLPKRKNSMPHLAINARSGEAKMHTGDIRAGDISELLAMGANYIAIGHSSPRVAAEFPLSSGPVDKARAKKIAAILIRLRDKSARE